MNDTINFFCSCLLLPNSNKLISHRLPVTPSMRGQLFFFSIPGFHFKPSWHLILTTAQWPPLKWQQIPHAKMTSQTSKHGGFVGWSTSSHLFVWRFQWSRRAQMTLGGNINRHDAAVNTSIHLCNSQTSAMIVNEAVWRRKTDWITLWRDLQLLTEVSFLPGPSMLATAPAAV